MKLSQIFNLTPGVYQVIGTPKNLDTLEERVYQQMFSIDSEDEDTMIVSEWDNSYIPESTFKHYFKRKCESSKDFSIATMVEAVNSTNCTEIYIFYPTARMTYQEYLEFSQVLCKAKSKNSFVYIFSYMQNPDIPVIDIDNLSTV